MGTLCCNMCSYWTQKPYLYSWYQHSLSHYFHINDRNMRLKWAAFCLAKRYGWSKSKWVGLEARNKKLHWIYLSSRYYLYLFVPYLNSSLCLQNYPTISRLLLLDSDTPSSYLNLDLEHNFIWTLPWFNWIYSSIFAIIFRSSSKHPVP